MNVIDKLNWRYATKKFDEDQYIPQQKIELIKEAFNLTATSYGLQPIKLLFLKDKKIQQELVQHSMDQEQVAQASHILIFCIETNIDKKYIVDYFERVKAIRSTPDHILQPFEDFLIDDFKGRSIDYIEDWATKQAYLAMGNLLTVLAIEHIDSCPMEGFTPKAWDDILGLTERGLKSVLMMPIGYRADDDMFSDFKKVRKRVADSTLEL
ncbi:MAG: NAD(P)H-dependent oxidoreductase [Flavobacteriaceae bacterium]|nr:NAD(P)H-dependent oxidoreductase [Flavobacteriaceae bacterium]